MLYIDLASFPPQPRHDLASLQVEKAKSGLKSGWLRQAPAYSPARVERHVLPFSYLQCSSHPTLILDLESCLSTESKDRQWEP